MFCHQLDNYICPILLVEAILINSPLGPAQAAAVAASAAAMRTPVRRRRCKPSEASCLETEEPVESCLAAAAAADMGSPLAENWRRGTLRKTSDKTLPQSLEYGLVKKLTFFKWCLIRSLQEKL